MNRIKATPALLSACALLLALNLVRGEPWALGQAVQNSTGTPTLVHASAEQMIGANGTGLGANRVWRFWSDGAVDMAVVDFTPLNECEIGPTCGPVPILPAACTTADLDHNAQVDISDLLGLLAFWGPCPEPLE